jgi:hypothetical protein
MTRRPGLPLALLALALVLVLAACVDAASSPTPGETATPTPTKSATPEPTDTPSGEPESEAPSPSASEVGELRPFAVAANPEADALFLDRDDCENAADGYRLEFPDAWYTNTAIGDVEPCSWFSPTSYEISDPSEVPPEIAITIEYLESDIGTSTDEAISREFGIVGGTQQAVRVEYGPGEQSAQPADWRAYWYVVQLGPTEEEGPNLVLRTSTEMGGDYELNKAVLDRIVATLELTGTIQ